MPYKDPSKKREANKLNARKLRAKDPEKYRAACRRYYLENIEKCRDYERKRACAKYGLTVEQFDSLWEKQDGKCAICGTSFVGLGGDQNLRPRIDHCHDSGFVRGLLCNKCNRALGLFSDDEEILRNALVYLQESKK